MYGAPNYMAMFQQALSWVSLIIVFFTAIGCCCFIRHSSGALVVALALLMSAATRLLFLIFPLLQRSGILSNESFRPFYLLVSAVNAVSTGLLAAGILSTLVQIKQLRDQVSPPRTEDAQVPFG